MIMTFLNIFNDLDDFIEAVIHRLGLYFQVPGIVVGVALLIVAFLMFRSVQSRAGGGTSTLGGRLVAGAALVLGLPILLTALGVSATDSLVWSLIALVVAGFWLSAERGKLVTVVGIVIGVLALGSIYGISQSAPSGSIVASDIALVVAQAKVTWHAFTAH
jgi:hypothetical protein